MNMNTGRRGLIRAFANSGVSAAVLAELTGSITDFRASIDGDLTTIRAELDRINSDAGSRRMGGGENDSAAALAANASVAAFMRAGTKPALPNASMTTQSDPDGGWLVPKEVDQVIDNILLGISPMRRLATIKKVQSGDYSKLVNRRGASSGWVGEEDDRDETASPHLGEIKPPIGEIYAEPITTQRLLDDSQFDVQAFLEENVRDEFSMQESTAFVVGNGMNKPRGFLTYPTAIEKDAARAFGTLQFVKTGGAASFGASNPADALQDLVSSLRSPYRVGEGVGWQMNSTTLGSIRKFKDGQGNYLWQPSLLAGQPETILGYPVLENDDMPDLGANSFPVAFGNWRRGYTIVDRTGTSLLRDPLTKKGWVKFYFTRRVGGAVIDSNAIKILKCAA